MANYWEDLLNKNPALKEALVGFVNIPEAGMTRKALGINIPGQIPKPALEVPSPEKKASAQLPAIKTGVFGFPQGSTKTPGEMAGFGTGLQPTEVPPNAAIMPKYGEKERKRLINEKQEAGGTFTNQDLLDYYGRPAEGQDWHEHMMKNVEGYLPSGTGIIKGINAEGKEVSSDVYPGQKVNALGWSKVNYLRNTPAEKQYQDYLIEHGKLWPEGPKTRTLNEWGTKVTEGEPLDFKTFKKDISRRAGGIGDSLARQAGIEPTPSTPQEAIPKGGESGRITTREIDEPTQNRISEILKLSRIPRGDRPGKITHSALMSELQILTQASSHQNALNQALALEQMKEGSAERRHAETIGVQREGHGIHRGHLELEGLKAKGIMGKLPSEIEETQAKTGLYKAQTAGQLSKEELKKLELDKAMKDTAAKQTTALVAQGYGKDMSWDAIYDLVHEKMAGIKPTGGVGKILDKITTAQLLKEAGGDKEKARKLAKERGYIF